jgi:predicted Zn-dependent peptidase
VVQFEANLGWPFGSASDYKDPGIYGIFLLHNPDFQGKQIVEQVQEELAKIQREGIEAKELDRAKTILRSGRINELQTSLARARYLAQYEMLDGDPNLVNTEMDRFMAVTPAEIKAVAARYLKPEVRRVLEVVPASAKEEKK